MDDQSFTIAFNQTSSTSAANSKIDGVVKVRNLRM